MIIRKATSQDSDSIAECMMLAMREIVYIFIGDRNQEKARSFLKYFIEQEGNQYSYQNCWVVEDKDKVIAVANVYDGAALYRLRQPVINYLKVTYQKDLNLENETQAGEFYIDSVGVNPDRQGQGIGTVLLQFLIEKYVMHEKQCLGLLIDEDNPAAERLYLKLGFKEVGKKSLVGKRMKHLQIGN